MVRRNGKPRWPEGVQLVEDKMVQYGRWCAPKELSGRVIRSHHAQIGHVEGERQREEVVRRYSFEPKVRIDQVIRDVSQGCEMG